MSIAVSGVSSTVVSEKTEAKKSTYFARVFQVLRLPITFIGNFFKGQTCEEKIASFWQQHIQPVTLTHGTSALFYTHFKTHGISAVYPEQLEKLITSIRQVWADHEDDIVPKTTYFHWFEYRYDKARKDKQIAMSFTGNSSIIEEYTTGARGSGGEWIRELRTFIMHANENKDVLTADELDIVTNTDALIDVMSEVPALKVRVSLTNLQKVPKDSVFQPLLNFTEYVKKKCPEYNSHELSRFLPTLLKKVKKQNDQLTTSYETTVFEAVKPELLSFEFVKDAYKLTVNTTGYSKLKFNKPKFLATDEICKLAINRKTNRSSIAEYADSEFLVTRKSFKDAWMVTRVKSSGPSKYQQFYDAWMQAFPGEIT